MDDDGKIDNPLVTVPYEQWHEVLAICMAQSTAAPSASLQIGC